MKLKLAEGLSLPLEWLTLATVVYGARGSGKTNFGVVCAEEATRAHQRFCAIDLKGDWYGLKSTADGKGEGLPVVIFGGDHADLPLEDGAGQFIGQTIAELEQSVILDLEHFSKGKQMRFLADFFENLYHHNRSPLLLLLDEAQRYAPQKPFGPDETRSLGGVQDLVKLGRKHGIGPVLFTQRGSGLNKEVSELCDVLVAFRTPGPLDQDRISGWLEANATKAQADAVMGQIARLATGTAVIASGHPDLEIFGSYKVRRRETFDSSATPKIGQRRSEPKRLAKPDLDALKTKMAATIEKAKADDPRELRKVIAQASKDAAASAKRISELEAKISSTSGFTHSNEKPKQEVEPKRVQVLTDADRALLEKLGAQVAEVHRVLASNLAFDLSDFLAEVQKRIDLLKLDLQTGQSDARADFVALFDRKSVQKILGKLATVQPPVSGRQLQLDKPVDKPFPSKHSGTVQPTRRAPVVSASNGDGGADLKIGVVHRAFLTVMANRQGKCTRRNQLAVFSGYSAKSRHVDNTISALRSAGLVVGASDALAITAAGLDVLGTWDELPSGRALIEYWIREAGTAPGAMLRALVDAYPKTMTRDEVAEASNYSPTSRHVDNSLSYLRTLELIEGDRATLRASEELFS